MEKRIVVIILFLIVVNLGFIWFGSMGFMDNGPHGSLIEYDLTKYGFDNLIADGLLFTGLALLAGIASTFLRINAFAVIMFTEIFWLPYTKTMAIFWEILESAPVAFLGLMGILTTLMLYCFAYALIDMSKEGGF